MKKLLVPVFALMMFLPASGQGARVRYLVDTYSGHQDVVSICIPGFLCKIAGNIADCTCEERELLRSIRSVRILTSDNKALNNRVSFVDEFERYGYDPGYRLMLSVNEGDEQVRILGNERSGKIRDLIIVASGDGENVLVCIRGRMKADMLHVLGDIVETEGMEHTREL